MCVDHTSVKRYLQVADWYKWSSCGAVLSVVRKGEQLPVAYFSRQLHGAEVNYSSMELECLGVVAALKYFKVYLAGRKFVLMTYHQALTGMSTSTNHN